MPRLKDAAGKTILVVDDEAAIREVVTDLLSDSLEGVNIVEAENGSAALQKIKDLKIDAILCDLRMPKMDGLQFLNEAKKRGIVAPLVFITGFPDDKNFLAALRNGAYGFIQKPFKRQEVIETLLHALRLHMEI